MKKKREFAKTPMYATEDAIWLDPFGVIDDSTRDNPKLLFQLDQYTSTLKHRYLEEHDGKYPK